MSIEDMRNEFFILVNSPELKVFDNFEDRCYEAASILRIKYQYHK
jgi:hypothetical protein